MTWITQALTMGGHLTVVACYGDSFMATMTWLPPVPKPIHGPLKPTVAEAITALETELLHDAAKEHLENEGI